MATTLLILDLIADPLIGSYEPPGTLTMIEMKHSLQTLCMPLFSIKAFNSRHNIAESVLN